MKLNFITKEDKEKILKKLREILVSPRANDIMNIEKLNRMIANVEKGEMNKVEFAEVVCAIDFFTIYPEYDANLDKLSIKFNKRFNYLYGENPENIVFPNKLSND